MKFISETGSRTTLESEKNSFENNLRLRGEEGSKTTLERRNRGDSKMISGNEVFEVGRFFELEPNQMTRNHRFK